MSFFPNKKDLQIKGADRLLKKNTTERKQSERKQTLRGETDGTEEETTFTSAERSDRRAWESCEI